MLIHTIRSVMFRRVSAPRITSLTSSDPLTSPGRERRTDGRDDLADGRDDRRVVTATAEHGPKRVAEPSRIVW